MAMDKLHEESRKQFDAWWHEEYCHLAGSDDGVFVKYAAWQAWQASRASIVVELPNGLTTREALDLGYMGDYAAGVDGGIEETAKVIRSIGLSIKGE
jgi:hypothetical protein